MKAAGYQPHGPDPAGPRGLCRLPPEEGVALLDNLDLLAQFGFAVRGVWRRRLCGAAGPRLFGRRGQVEAALSRAGGRAAGTGAGPTPRPPGTRLLHTMACKAAIKGGLEDHAGRSC